MYPRYLPSHTCTLQAGQVLLLGIVRSRSTGAVLLVMRSPCTSSHRRSSRKPSTDCWNGSPSFSFRIRAGSYSSQAISGRRSIDLSLEASCSWAPARLATWDIGPALYPCSYVNIGKSTGWESRAKSNTIHRTGQTPLDQASRYLSSFVQHNICRWRCECPPPRYST